MFDCCHCANDAPFSSVSVAAITDAAMPADLLAGHVSEFLSFQCNHPPDLVFQVEPDGASSNGGLKIRQVLCSPIRSILIGLTVQ